MAEPMKPSTTTECTRCGREYTGTICPFCGLEVGGSTQWHRCSRCHCSFRGTACPECGLQVLESNAASGPLIPPQHKTAVRVFYIFAAIFSMFFYFVSECYTMGLTGIFVAIIGAQWFVLLPVTVVFLILSFKQKNRGKFYRTVFFSNLFLLLAAIFLGIVAEVISALFSH